MVKDGRECRTYRKEHGTERIEDSCQRVEMCRWELNHNEKCMGGTVPDEN